MLKETENYVIYGQQNRKSAINTILLFTQWKDENINDDISCFNIDNSEAA